MKYKKLIVRGIWVGLAVLFLSIAISLAIGEFIIKHTVPQETYNLARLVGLYIFEESPIIPFTLKKNVKDFYHISFTREFTHEVSTNSQRTRGEEFSPQKEDGTYRILVLGDSMTFGWGVENKETFSSVLEAKLNEPVHRVKEYKKAEVINAGFTDGFTLDSYYLFYRDIGSLYNPDLVILNFFPYNDISELIDSNWVKTDSKGMPEKIESKTHYVRDGYLTSRKKSNWKFEIPVLRNMHLGIMFMNALDSGAPKIVEKIKKAVNISDAKEELNLEKKLSCIYSLLERDCPLEMRQSIDKTKLLILEIRDIAKSKNQSLIVTMLASPDQTIPLSKRVDRVLELVNPRPQKFLSDFLRENGILHFDLLPSLSVPDRAERFYFKQDGHLNSEGHRQVGLSLLEFLEKSAKSY